MKAIQDTKHSSFITTKGRHGEWKLVAVKQNKKMTTWELYNLKQDPTEQRNVADEIPQKVQELSAIWDAESTRLATQAHID